jgi:hypothetical protein
VLCCSYTIALYCYYTIKLYQFYLIVETGLIPPAGKCGPAALPTIFDHRGL